MSKENLVKSVFEAIQNRNLVKLKEILEQLPSKTKKEVLEAKNGSGDAALAYAIYPHVFNDEIVEYLIKQGADPNKMLHNQCFLLHIAILKDYLASAKALINNGADINVKNQGEEALEHMKLSNPLNGRTALHFAIQLYNEYKNTVEVHHEGKSEFDKKVEAGGLSKISGDYKAKLNEVKRIEESERKIFQTKKEGIEKEEDRQKRRKSIKTLRTDQEAMNEKFEQQKKEAENSYKLEVNNYEDLEKTAKKYDKYAAKAVEGIEFIKFLVNKGANLTAEDRAGKTSLSIAKKRSDNQELVEFLENAYASQGDKRETNKKSDSTSKHQPNNTQEQSMSFCSRKLAVISVAAITCSLALYFLAPLIMGSSIGVGTQLALGAVGAVVGGGIGILTNVAVDQCYVNLAAQKAD